VTSRLEYDQLKVLSKPQRKTAMSKSKTGNRQVLSRRDALKLSAGAGVAAAIASAAHASDSIKTGVHQQQPPFCSTPHPAVANTIYGKVRGFVSGDVFTFKGVPYGQDTGGEIAGCRPSLLCLGRVNTPRSSTEPIVRSTCTIGTARNRCFCRTGMMAGRVRTCSS